MTETDSFPEYWRDECVLFEEAINWIAFGQFGYPGLGPQLLYAFATAGATELVDRETSYAVGRTELARELLFDYGGRSKVRIFGRRAVAIDPPYRVRTSQADYHGATSANIGRKLVKVL